VILGGCLALAAVGRPWVRDGGLIDLLLGAVGWFCFVAGALLRIWATLYIGGRKGKALLTSGPYAATRNPLYLGSFLIACSCALFVNSLLGMIGVVLTATAYVLYVIPIEERRLSGRFGKEYEAYCRRTPRFIPRLKQTASVPQQLLTVDVRALAVETSRAVGWLMVPLVADVMSFLRDQPWWPHLIPLP
jgi:protein-S-isoprenylcysteine O-methyltransferase Ste14